MSRTDAQKTGGDFIDDLQKKKNHGAAKKDKGLGTIPFDDLAPHGWSETVYESSAASGDFCVAQG